MTKRDRSQQPPPSRKSIRKLRLLLPPPPKNAATRNRLTEEEKQPRSLTEEEREFRQNARNKQTFRDAMAALHQIGGKTPEEVEIQFKKHIKRELQELRSLVQSVIERLNKMKASGVPPAPGVPPPPLVPPPLSGKSGPVKSGPVKSSPPKNQTDRTIPPTWNDVVKELQQKQAARRAKAARTSSKPTNNVLPTNKVRPNMPRPNIKGNKGLVPFTSTPAPRTSSRTTRVV